MVSDPSDDMLKVGAAIVRFIVVVAVMPADVPVIVNGYWPTGTELAAYRYRVLADCVGLADQRYVTPLGKPATDKLTLPENPYWSVTYTYAVVELP